MGRRKHAQADSGWQRLGAGSFFLAIFESRFCANGRIGRRISAHAWIWVGVVVAWPGTRTAHISDLEDGENARWKSREASSFQSSGPAVWDPKLSDAVFSRNGTWRTWRSQTLNEFRVSNQCSSMAAYRPTPTSPTNTPASTDRK